MDISGLPLWLQVVFYWVIISNIVCWGVFILYSHKRRNNGHE